MGASGKLAAAGMRLLDGWAVQALDAGMQYTLRNVPDDVDQALRERARREGRSLNELLIQALREALGLRAEPPRRRSAEGVAGTWTDDPEVDAALEAERRIDDAAWR